MPLESPASAILVYDAPLHLIKSFLLGEWSSSSYPLLLFNAVALVSVVLYGLDQNLQGPVPSCPGTHPQLSDLVGARDACVLLTWLCRVKG